MKKKRLAPIAHLVCRMLSGNSDYEVQIYRGLQLLFHRSTEVAIQALVFLAQQSPGKLSPTHEVATEAGVPEAYLAKILQQLAVSGLVRAFRGSGKGVELGRPADAIPLSSVIRAAQGGLDSEKCILGLNVCSEHNPCSLHQEWLPHRDAIQKMLERTTVADLVRSLHQPLSEKETTQSGNVPPAGGTRR